MIDPGDEAHFWRFERIVSWKMNVQKEDSSLVWAIWGTHNCSLPMEKIITNWTRGALSWGVSADVLKLLVDSFQSHFLYYGASWTGWMNLISLGGCWTPWLGQAWA